MVPKFSQLFPIFLSFDTFGRAFYITYDSVLVT